MFKKRFGYIITCILLIAFIVAGCSSQPAAPAPQKPAATAPAVDKTAVTKDAAWTAYTSMVNEVNGKTFPLDAAKAREAYQGNEAKYLVIDMRAAEDYAKGHVKGAVNIPLASFPQNLDKLPTDKTLMLYCYTGQQSAVATVPLKAYGYKAVSISRGVPSVEQAGFAMDTAAAPFNAATGKTPADPKEAAAREGLKEVFDALAKQAAAKTLIVKGADVKGLVDSAPDKYAIIDLRAPEDYAKGYVKGAVNIPLAQLKEKIGSISKDKTVVLYCYSGQTAGMATVPLKVEGYKLMSVSTGFSGVTEGKLALEKK